MRDVHLNYSALMPTGTQFTASAQSSLTFVGTRKCQLHDQLLKWTDRDEATQKARELGGPLSEGESLYQDLQNIYKS